MTNRQQEFLKSIIEQYIHDGEPVGSKHFIKKHNLKISSATVRNEMMALEKEGFLEKSHTSSGRVPSQEGYKYYAEHIKNRSSKNLIKKLNDIFSKRRVSIDFTMDEAARAITETVGLTLVTSSSKNNELMKSITLTPIDKSMATVVIVTSAGRVESKIIELNRFTTIEDVRIAVRLFKERLIDTQLRDLAAKVESLSSILSKNIINYESVIQAFISKVFDFHEKIKNKVYGNTNIIKSNISRDDLAKLLDMIQNKSIFSLIEGEADDDENIKIDIRPNNTSILTSKVNHHNTSTEISVVGTNRMDYAEAKQAIKILHKFLKGDQNEQQN